jgi:hypothetical protein
MKVKRPRLRHKTEGQLKIPAYEMLARIAASVSRCWARYYAAFRHGNIRKGCCRRRRRWGLAQCHTTWREGPTPTWCSVGVPSAWVLIEKHSCRIDGHDDLWALAAIPGAKSEVDHSPF